MTWNYYGEGEDFILKEKKQVPKELLDSLDAKGRKKLKRFFNQQNLLNSSDKTLLN